MSWCGRRASAGDVRRFSVVVAVMFVGVVGCSDDDSPTMAPPTEQVETMPTAIHCGTQYRPNAESLAGAEEERFAVERPSGLDSNSNRVAFEELSIEVVYNDRPDGQDVSVVVAGSDGMELERVLYQLPAALPSFAGGHGFTGLHYVSAGSAQLQWWCESEQ
jgi:hypothetical protein